VRISWLSGIQMAAIAAGRFPHRRHENFAARAIPASSRALLLSFMLPSFAPPA
jgi:hypothetical protein